MARKLTGLLMALTNRKRKLGCLQQTHKNEASSPLQTAGNGTSSTVRDLRESKRPADQSGLAKGQHLAAAAKASPLKEQRHTLSNPPTFTLKQAV